MKAAFNSTKNKGKGMFFPLFFSILASILVVIFVAFSSSVLVSKLDLPANFAPFSLISLGLGSLTFGLCIAKQFREKRYFLNGVAALVFGSLFLIFRLLSSADAFTTMSLVKIVIIMIPMFAMSFCVKTRTKPSFSH